MIVAREEADEYRLQPRVNFTAYVIRRMHAKLMRDRLAGFRHVFTWHADGKRVRAYSPNEVKQ